MGSRYSLAVVALVASFAVTNAQAIGGSPAHSLTREEVNAALPALEQMAQQQIDTGAVPGLAIAVVYKDEVVYLKGFGFREAGKPDLVTPDTVFQLASLSKPISATVVAALVSDGVISWDSRVADLDPAFQLHDAYPTQQVTVRDLFAHRSGLPGAAGDELDEMGYSRAEVVKRLRLVSPSSSFRSAYSYSNAGLTEGAVAAAKPTGKTWDEVAEEKLYRPLGMSSTSSRYSDLLKRTDRAELHIKTDGAWTAKIKRDADTQSPAGGASSSARDLAQWMRLELGRGIYNGKRLIASSALDETHVPLMARGLNQTTGATSFYGLGWNVEFGRHGLAWGHAGAFSVGARTVATLFPDSDLGIVVLTNAFPTGVTEGLSDSFADLVFDGKVEKDWFKAWNGVFEGLFEPAIAAAKAKYGTPPASATAALPNGAYVGNYANDYLGAATISENNGALTLSVGPGGRHKFPLRHFDRDTFICFGSPEMPDLSSAVKFTMGADEKASAVTVDFLNEVGLGTLQGID